MVSINRRSTSTLNVSENSNETSARSDASETEANAAISHAYRIEKFDGNGRDVSGITETNSSVKTFLDNICVVFPSAFKSARNTVSGVNVSDSVSKEEPFVIVHPKLLNNFADDKDLLLALDALCEKGCQSRFLSEASIEWARASHHETAPLYIVLLKRIISAACVSNDLSFRTRTAQYTVTQDLVTYCQATQFKPPTLSQLSSMFLGPCPETSFAECPLETLSLTPLSWLVWHYSGKNGTAIDLEVIDAGLYGLLKRGTDGSPCAVGLESVNESATPPSTKKKKKMKKHRRNKASALLPPIGPLQLPVCAVVSNSLPSFISSQSRKFSNADTVGSNETGPDDEVVHSQLESKQQNAPPLVLGATHSQTLQDDSVVKAASVNVPESFSEVEIIPVHSVDSCDTDSGKSENTDGSVKTKDSKDEKPMSTASTATCNSHQPEATKAEEEEGDHAWETVEVKIRASRKKGASSTNVANNGGQRSAQHSSSNNANANGSLADQQGNGHKKKHHRLPIQKKTKANRKVVKDILNSLLDSVDDEVKRRASQQALRRPIVANNGNAWKSGPPPVNASASLRNSDAPSSEATVKVDSTPVTLRDVVLGRQSAAPKKSWATAASTPPTKPSTTATATSKTLTSSLENTKRPSAWQTDRLKVHEAISPNKGAVLKKPKGSATSADQSTAPTFQESTSASSNTNAATKNSPTSMEDKTSKEDSSSANTDEAPPLQARALAQKRVEPASEVGPPLPMLLNPDNANSANSSVASSLEAPHTTRHHHHSNLDVNDVGYHLLDVCDRLSRDMQLFMTRRGLALSARRQERSAIVSALQDTVSNIWPGSGHAEMYGSCATQTDLPSSDIDVVVVGLDQNKEMTVGGSQNMSRSGSMTIGASKSFEETGKDDFHQAHQVAVTNFSPLQMQRMLSADRVVRLGAELETKAWAVKVNAIPTASVPVVKVLTDPSKLPGGSFSGDWMAHQQLQASATAPLSDTSSVASHQSTASHHYPQQQYNPPWRGADVMNGLLSLDITFEGAGHGGIGSTQFSARVIADACQEAGVHPDDTVLVQTMMVLKELLAQRKLNEPYSGGLSSYAVLLLVLALLQERAVIREEIERSERQRRAMSNGVGAGPFGATCDVDATPKAGPVKSPNCPRPSEHMKKKLGSTQEKQQSTSPASSMSSWASIAKKNQTNKAQVAAAKPIGKESDNVTCKVQPDKKNSATSIPAQELVNGDPTVLQPHLPLIDTPSLYPQGYNDIIEVLCSGEMTAGKLLMHFLLYYGQHFDAQSTAIDVSGKHERSFSVNPYSFFSPYIPRRAAGTIDPVSGMLTVDPIVIYDPLEGAENNNVAKRCFAWNSVRWIFAQSYATLSSAVERSATPPATPLAAAGKGTSIPLPDVAVGDMMADPSSPLLSCLLSF
jgi:hypothetical protein